MESRTNQSVTPDVQALMLENLKLAKRVEVLENTLSAGKEVLTLEEAARFMGVTKSSLYKMTHEQTFLITSRMARWCISRKRNS